MGAKQKPGGKPLILYGILSDGIWVSKARNEGSEKPEIIRSAGCALSSLKVSARIDSGTWRGWYPRYLQMRPQDPGEEL